MGNWPSAVLLNISNVCSPILHEYDTLIQLYEALQYVATTNSDSVVFQYFPTALY